MVEEIPPFPSRIRKIADGESVEASIANRAPDGLDQRTEHLKSRLDLAQAGSTLILTDAPLDDDVLVGHLVFRDTTESKFRRALAAISDAPSSTTGLIEVAESTFVWGVVIDKEVGFGTILLAGILSTDFDFTNTIEDDPLPTGDFEPGAYFLSSLTEGTATKQPKIAGLFQFFLAEDGTARFLPAQHGILEAHIHQTIDLIAEPAGLANCVTDVDDIHEITQPDSNLPGWLPADDPTFGGSAPVGAKFGYNVAKDPTLSKFFPPVPLEGTFLVKNGLIVPSTDIIVDNSGIWWLRDDFGNVPWPVDIDECDLGGGSSSSTPGQTDVELRLFMTEFVTKTGESVVTRLRLTEDENNIQLLNEDGTVNTTGVGSLRLALDLDLTAGLDNVAGFLAVKEVDANEFKRGPIVEKIVPGPSGRILIRNVDTAAPQGQGTIEVDIAAEPPSPEAANLNVVTASPSTVVTVQPGSLWFDDGTTFVNVPSATTSPVFNGVSTGGVVRYDLLQINVEDLIAGAPTFLEIVQGAEVPAPGDPFDDAPAVTAGKLPRAIIKIEELAGLVDITDDDITNLASINRVFRAPGISDLRQDGLDTSGSPNDAGSLGTTGAPAAFVRADHAHPTNTSGVTPSADGAGAPGTATPYARSDHRHPANVDSVDPEPLATAASPGVSTIYARRDHVHPGSTPVRQRFSGGVIDADKFRIYEAEVVAEDGSEIISVTRASPLDLSFAALDTNQAGGIVYTTDAGAEAVRVDRWYAVYLLKHPSLGTKVIASLVYKNFDNIRPSAFAAETIVKGDPPFPTSAFAGAKFKRLTSIYVTGTGDIRAFDQVDGIISPRDALTSLIAGTNTGTKGNLTFDLRFGCPPGTIAMRLRIKVFVDHLVRVFRTGFDPGTPPDALAGNNIFANRGEFFSINSFIGPPVGYGTPPLAKNFWPATQRIYSDLAMWHFDGGGATSGTNSFVEAIFFAQLDDPEIREIILRLEPGFVDSTAGGNRGVFFDTVYEDPSITFYRALQ